MIEDEAVRSFEEGGRGPALGEYLGRTRRLLFRPATTSPIASGRDLASGEDRSALLARRWPTPNPEAADPPCPMVDSWSSSATLGRGRYRFLVLLPDRFDPSGHPALLRGGRAGHRACSATSLAVHFAAPLRESPAGWSTALAPATCRRGPGRARKDEIGELSRAFDEMAGQIQTLRAAEIRLLAGRLARVEVAPGPARLQPRSWARSGGDDARGRRSPGSRRTSARLSRLVGELLELTCAEGDPGLEARREARSGWARILGRRAGRRLLERRPSAKGCRLSRTGGRRRRGRVRRLAPKATRSCSAEAVENVAPQRDPPRPRRLGRSRSGSSSGSRDGSATITGEGPRPRGPGASARVDLRALLPGRRRPEPGRRRGGPGPLHRPTLDRAPPGADPRPERRARPARLDRPADRVAGGRVDRALSRPDGIGSDAFCLILALVLNLRSEIQDLRSERGKRKDLPRYRPTTGSRNNRPPARRPGRSRLPGSTRPRSAWP